MIVGWDSYKVETPNSHILIHITSLVDGKDVSNKESEIDSHTKNSSYWKILLNNFSFETVC